MIRVTTKISFPEPESVLNSVLADDLFGVDGQGGENYTEFSAIIVCGNRTAAQTFKPALKGPQFQEAFDALIEVWSGESTAMMVSIFLYSLTP